MQHVRVLAASEGDSETPYHVVPAMQPRPREYSRDALEGLDYLLRELARRVAQRQALGVEGVAQLIE